MIARKNTSRFPSSLVSYFSDIISSLDFALISGLSKRSKVENFIN